MALALATATAVAVALVAHHDTDADLGLAKEDIHKVAASVLLYAQDFDDRLPANAGQVAAIIPYTHRVEDFMPFPKDKPAVVYRGPDVMRSGAQVVLKSEFVFNRGLFGVETGKIAKRSETVLWSYGARGRLNFGLRGKTLIAFADASEKFASRAAAKKLRWKP